MKINFTAPDLKDVYLIEKAYRQTVAQQQKLIIAFNMEKLLNLKEIDSIILKPVHCDIVSISNDNLFSAHMVSSDPVFHIKFSVDYREKLNNEIEKILTLSANFLKNRSKPDNTSLYGIFKNIKTDLSPLQQSWLSLYSAQVNYDIDYKFFGKAELEQKIVNKNLRINIPEELKNCANQICGLQQRIDIDTLKQLSKFGEINLFNLSTAQKLFLSEDLYNQWIIENDKNNLEKTIALASDNQINSNKYISSPMPHKV